MNERVAVGRALGGEFRVQPLGPHVNLANVPASSIVDTEATRTGLGTAGPVLGLA